MSFWEHHLPWALLKILQTLSKIKGQHRARGGSAPNVGRGRAAVCSKDVSSAFVPGKRGSAIAAIDAGRRRGNGRGGRASRPTEPRGRANRNGTGKVGATGSASGTATPPRKRRLEGPRGSSLRIFFRGLLRPAGLLREVRTQPEITAATVLLAPVPTCDGARVGAGTALAGGTGRTPSVSTAFPECAPGGTGHAREWGQKIVLTY